MAEVESRSEALLIYSVGWLVGWMWAGSGLGSAGDCRADLILDAVNPPGVFGQRSNERDGGKAKASVWFRPLQEYAAWTRL